MYFRLIAALVAAACGILSHCVVTAHPLGNFSISQYSAIQIGNQEVDLRYIVDMAEIPTFQEIQESGFVAKADDVSAIAYAARTAESLRGGLMLEIDGRPVPLRPESHEIIFPEGAGGLPTLKIGVVYKGKLAIASGGGYSLNYRDGNFPGRAGWKEIIAVAAPGVRLLNSSVPETDRSTRLSNYPTDLLNSPPQQLEARVGFAVTPLPTAADNSSSASKPAIAKSETAPTETIKAGSNRSPRETLPTTLIEQANSDLTAKNSTAARSLHLKANSQATPRSSFTEIMARKELGWGIILAALAVAAGLGAFHALEPGHGKTLVAAYLVGSRGTVKHAVLLGLIVTAAHTAGVYLLGAITLYASKYIVPERLYPWLGALSGVMIAVLGLILLVRRYQGRDGLLGQSQHDPGAHDHSAHGDHDHDERDHARGHHHHHGGHGHHHHEVNQAVSLKQLLALGISGGIVPCPAA